MGTKLKSKPSLEYRKAVKGLVLDSNSDILLVQKHSYSPSQWDVPGGGVKPGETPHSAMLRELREELGSDRFNIMGRSKRKYRYKWPAQIIRDNISNRGWSYEGQDNHQFVLRFVGKKAEIHIQQDEIRRVIWVPIQQIEDFLHFPGQLTNIQALMQEFELN